MIRIENENLFKYWQTKIFILVWISYFSFYLVRLNFSVGIPGMINEFGFTKTELGLVLSAFFTAYAIGQFVNGHIGNHLNSRYYISIGLILSSLINLIFGLFFYPNITVMAILWGSNGFFQSMGWAPSVKTVSNWFSHNNKAKHLTVLGTSYILGGAFAIFFAGIIVSKFSWRFVFIIPSLVSLCVALIWLYFGREGPERVRHNWKQNNIVINKNDMEKKNPFVITLKNTIFDKNVLILGVALLGLNIVRYGFLDWAPTFLYETQKMSVSSAAYKSLLFPIAGVFGALTAGYFSHRIFSKNLAKTAGAMLVGLLICMCAFPYSLSMHWSVSLVLLLLMGFLAFGPHVLLVSVFPGEIVAKNSVSAAVGTIDSLGYVGAALSGYATGKLVDLYGWNYGLYFWITGAILSLSMMILLMIRLRSKTRLSGQIGKYEPD